MDNWLSSVEVSRILELEGCIDQLLDLFSIRMYLDSSHFSKDYEVSEEWSQLVSLTKEGTRIQRLLQSAEKEISDHESKFILFVQFLHYRILIDSESSCITDLLRLVSEEILQRKLRIPHRFGRELYDKFNDTYLGNRTNHLPADEAEDLIGNEENGVYQVGQFVSGPLGLIPSDEKRFTPPNLALPLWHCSDTGCSALHTVKLIQYSHSFLQRLTNLRERLLKDYGPSSEWARPLFLRLRKNRGPNSFFDLLAVICDALVPKEVEEMFLALMRSQSGPIIRGRISSSPLGDGRSQGSPEEVSSQLSHLMRCQLLMTLSDSQLIGTLDALTTGSVINVPASEKRVTRQQPRKYSYGDTRTEISQLGVRSRRGIPIANLAVSIYAAYEHKNLIDRLDWKIRNRRGSGTQSALVRYIEENSPQIAIKEMVLSEQEITEYFQNSDIEITFTHEIDFDADRLAWKLGFDLPVFDDMYPRLTTRLNSFSDVVRSMSGDVGEDEREAIRAVGVNFFVSVEAYLEELIAYNAWLLSQDHFAQTKFRYNYVDALNSVPIVLGVEATSGAASFAWSTRGENTLGVLLVYLEELARWLNSLKDADRSPYMRPKQDLPHFSDDNHREFLFRHTCLWADSHVEEFNLYCSRFDAVANQIRQSVLAYIRNGIDHKRPGNTFPSTEKMVNCAKHFQEAIELAETHRIFPVEFWGMASEMDNRGYMKFVFKDVNGITLMLYGPSISWAEPEFHTDRPMVIAPGNLLGIPNAELVFSKQHESLFSEYWKAYPRRRSIPPNFGNDDMQPLERGA